MHTQIAQRGSNVKANHDIIAAIFDTRDAKPWSYHGSVLYVRIKRKSCSKTRRNFSCAFFNASPRSCVPKLGLRCSGIVDRKADDPQGVVIVRVYYLPRV